MAVKSVYGSSDSESESDPEALEASRQHSEHEEECAHSSVQEPQPRKKKKVTQREEDDAIPLPYPFPLPKHYGTEVDKALETKKFTKSIRVAFIGKIASAMLYYKQLPTTADYINVSQSIIFKEASIFEIRCRNN